MARNIIIYSDGTGQVGGVAFDECRSNIYKMYRATRVGPDSRIDPAEQVAYYDAGLGSRPPGGGTFSSVYRAISNFVSQATGLGLTTNIIDCYQMIIRHWRPGDRIFLFGFSRGAYTVRCLGGVLAHCGVPTRLGDGQPLTYDSATLRRVATRAVKRVYQHTASHEPTKASPRQKELLTQRRELARQFRAQHGVDLDTDKSHYPYFIGVFDTVAAIASRGSQAVLLLGIALLVSLVSTLLWWFHPSYTPLFGDVFGNYLTSLFDVFGLSITNWWHWTYFVAAVSALGIGAWYAMQAIRFAPAADKKKWKTFTFNWGRMSFEDITLNDNIPYARHAISIDEERASFDRVRWGDPKSPRPFQDEQGFIAFQQKWFAGNHSDIGGSYEECESRLSDIALDWMIEAATTVKDGVKIDDTVLRRYPLADGMQHCQRRVGFPFLTSRLGITWPGKRRNIRPDAVLHPTVIERANLPAVLQYDRLVPYRPEALRNHKDTAHLYADIPKPPSRTGLRKYLASYRLNF
jgi:uncharacterized protein (DUF2235 family)